MPPTAALLALTAKVEPESAFAAKLTE